VVQPHVGGERANPVIFDASVRDDIIAGQLNTGCRQWQADNATAVAPWATDNRRYRLDIDTEADLAAFQRDTGHRLSWPTALAAPA
jgi:molybdenum cofactor cytidylyltransferase